MTDSGIYQVVKERGAQAGLDDLHTPPFQAYLRPLWLSQDGGETDLMRLAGWRSRSMLGRYGRARPTSVQEQLTSG